MRQEEARAQLYRDSGFCKFETVINDAGVYILVDEDTQCNIFNQAGRAGAAA